ncbi:hypothetical protein ITJ64_17465 [Herbiconiux sp. VKM Ac-1786]|uniref:hypothetical protein n=1 Tax=Herbiconiux sp. VKM Ac-1786 TaxID=2783824 RepID=UPI00188D99D2|nr:hypothetical protein [Herbiconiux sp. VKM Ac-1786]MBF4574303.1 hypothetical protein [Herbiconiux sp. VKM Ac-1786]
MTSARWSLVVAGLWLASAGLQVAASLERWVVAAGSWTRDQVSIKDHRFDYSWPADPWENVGAAAQLHGAGLLLLAIGLLLLPRAAAGRNPGLDGVAVIVIAALAGFDGIHVLASGLLGFPSPLQYLPVQLLLTGVSAIGLVYLAAERFTSTTWPAAIACLLLVGSTMPGLLVAAFVIAPAVVGYQSFDTTPWTETIVAAWTALAAVAMLVAAGLSARKASIGRRRTNQR